MRRNYTLIIIGVVCNLMVAGCAGSKIREEPITVALEIATLGFWTNSGAGNGFQDMLTDDHGVPSPQYPPSSPLVQTAVRHIQKRRYQEAIQLLTQALQQNGLDASAYFYRAYAGEELYSRMAKQAQLNIERCFMDTAHNLGQGCIMGTQMLPRQIQAARDQVKRDLDFAVLLRQRHERVGTPR